MKGDANFRTMSKSEVMCKNEVFIYKKVIPFFKKFLKDNSASLFDPEEWWTPRIYFADYDYYPEISDQKETILALENIKPAGFRMGPKIDLDEAHLRLMIRNIAYYHSVNYALRIKCDSKLMELSKEIVPLSFLSESGEELGSYRRLFEIGLARFFYIIETNEIYRRNEKYVEKVNDFKEKYFKQPLVLMERFLKPDDVFTIILHGDYNRNNVLFQYHSDEGFENPPKAIKMIDFQEVRFATPVIDLSFFMYMNINQNLREHVWDSLLKYYHETVIESLCDILKCNKNDSRLNPYSYEDFMSHFKKHAFYAIPICLHYVPWIASPEDDLAKISHLFETDMSGEALFDILQICGGKEVNDRITSIAEHAFKKGYMDVI